MIENTLFGPGWDGTPAAREMAHVPTPVGETCFDCLEEIGPDDSGIILTCIERRDPQGGCEPQDMVARQRPRHRECDLRHIFGGVNHQKGLCHCCGGSEDPDPPGLTRRQAALAAVDYYERVGFRQHLADRARRGLA